MVDLWLNFGFAWISMVLVFVLSIIYVFRVLIRNSEQVQRLDALS